MIWLLIYLLGSILAGVVWFNIFKEWACVYSLKEETTYEIKWSYVVSTPIIILFSWVALFIGLLVADGDDIELIAFKIKTKTK